MNQALATLAFFGVGVNLVLFLTRVLGQDNAEAANNVSKWTGTVYMFSLIGAFLSDSYWGRYLTCTIFQLFFILVGHHLRITDTDARYNINTHRYQTDIKYIFVQRYLCSYIIINMCFFFSLNRVWRCHVFRRGVS